MLCYRLLTGRLPLELRGLSAAEMEDRVLKTLPAAASQASAAGSRNAGAGFAGFNDWRLPNIKELMSLVERQCAAPAVNAGIFPGLPPSARFWSSTTYVHNDTASVLDMNEGTNATAPKNGASGSGNYVILVR